jgi:hypothetical protein
MWLNLDSNRQYRFEGSIDPVLFFQHLSHLVAPADTLVLGCYDARPDIRRYLAVEACPPAWHRFHVTEDLGYQPQRTPGWCGVPSPRRSTHVTTTRGVCRERRGAHRSVRSRRRILSRTSLADLSRRVFGTAICFHRIPRRNVEAFARGIWVPFEEIDFDQTYFPGTTPP